MVVETRRAKMKRLAEEQSQHSGYRELRCHADTSGRTKTSSGAGRIATEGDPAPAGAASNLDGHAVLQESADAHPSLVLAGPTGEAGCGS